jgi:GT2 family glycosyltransferase
MNLLSTDPSMDHEVSETTISVIIVSWNACAYLMQCLASLYNQPCRYSMEIIVVDNASSDGSADRVANLYPNVRLIRNAENLGFAKANNIGILASTGRYLCLVNSDVKILPHCIDRLVDYCEGNPKVGMVGPRVIGRDGKLQRSCRGFPTVWNMFCRALALDSLFPGNKAFTGFSMFHWPQDSLRLVDMLTGCFWLIRKEAVSQVGLLDESFFIYGEDMDWCKRFWKKGWQLAFVPSAEAIHYGGASSSNSPVRFYVERHKADLQYWKKHHSTPAVASYFVIVCLHLSLRGIVYSIAGLFRKPARQVNQYKAKRSLISLGWLISCLFRTAKISRAIYKPLPKGESKIPA